jgi:capsular exopolysaccharide synthesis family protein
LVAALALVFSLHQAKRYQATALVEVSRQDLAATITGNSSNVPVGTDFSRVLQTDAIVASSATVANTAAQLAGTPGAAKRLLADVSVTTNPDDDLLAFSVTYGSPDTATKLANAYAQAYTTYQAALDTAALQRAQAGVAAQIAKLHRNKSAIALNLLTSQSELQVLTAVQSSNTTVARPAASATQVAPRPVRNGVVGLILGLILGVATAFFAYAIDTRIQEGAEIAERIGAPLLARIAAPGRRRRNAKEIVVFDEPHGPDAEAFRILRANLYASAVPPSGCVIVTSALGAEGKSTTAANLAVTLARGGTNVILVDFDLRKPTIASLFHIDGAHAGLTGVILDEYPISDALVQVDVGQVPGSSFSTAFHEGALSVMTAGAASSSVGELVSSNLVSPVLEQLRSLADLVILDGPPALGVGDVTALAPRIDGILVVARLGVVTRGNTDELARLLRRLSPPVLGVVATGVDPGSDGYGYGYGYYAGGSNGQPGVEEHVKS